MQNSTTGDSAAQKPVITDTHVAEVVQSEPSDSSEKPSTDSGPSTATMNAGAALTPTPALSSTDSITTSSFSSTFTSLTIQQKQQEQKQTSADEPTKTDPPETTTSPPTVNPSPPATTSASSSTRPLRQAMAVQQSQRPANSAPTSTSSSSSSSTSDSSSSLSTDSSKSSDSVPASTEEHRSDTPPSSSATTPATTDSSSDTAGATTTDAPAILAGIPSSGDSSGAVSTSTSLIKANEGFASGNKDTNSSQANSSAGSAKVGNLSVYALAGIIAGVLLVAAASYIAWDKWRKMKIAQEEELGQDPFTDKAAMPPPPSGSILRDPYFYPAPKSNPAENDGTSSFWNDSRSTRPTMGGESAPSFPPVPMHQAQSDGYVMNTWFQPAAMARDVQPAASIRSSIIEPPPPAAVAAGTAVTAAAAAAAASKAPPRRQSQDLLQANLNPRDSRRFTGGTGRTNATNATSTSSQLDMVSTYAGYGDDPPTAQGSIFSAVTPQENRWTGVSSGSVYSPDAQSAVDTLPPMPNKADWRISNYRKSYKPMPHDTISEEEAISFEEELRDPPPGPNFGRAPAHVPIAGSGLDFRS